MCQEDVILTHVGENLLHHNVSFFEGTIKIFDGKMFTPNWMSSILDSSLRIDV